MKIIRNINKDFFKNLKLILDSRLQKDNKKIDDEVKKIINKIKNKGDKALFYFTKKFDEVDLNERNLLLSSKMRNSYKK